MGTDDLGQDLLARMLYGGRISLAVGLSAMLVAIVVGTIVGAIAGMSRGDVGIGLMWLADLFLAIPQLPLLLLVIYLFRDALKSVFGPEGGVFILIVVVIGGLRWMPVARLVRAQFLSLREKEFVEAARALGASKTRQVVRHILPNALGPVIVAATIDVAAAIIQESTLSFLGLGFPPDIPTWGRILYDAKDYLDIAPHWALFPGAAIFLTVLSINFIGDGLRDALDPRRVLIMGGPLLDIRGLKTHFKTDDGMVRAVDGVDISIGRGETVGVVGESGCGKTVTAMSVLKLVPMPPGIIVDGQIVFEGRDLVPLERRGDGRDPQQGDRHRLPGADDLAQPGLHRSASRSPRWCAAMKACRARTAWRKPSRCCGSCRSPIPSGGVRDYPHQFSGGMRQRVMIAMALSCNPKLLIADEPTTALDVTIQAQILDLLQDMKSRFGMAIMLITHAMGVVAETAQRVVVMYAGKVIEEAPVEKLFAQPRHPYTQGLIRSIPRIDRAAIKKARLEAIGGVVPSLLDPPPGCRFAARCKFASAKCYEAVPPLLKVDAGPQGRVRAVQLMERRLAEPLLSVKGLVKNFSVRGGVLSREVDVVHAVDGVSFEIGRGETLGLVGESGCGKSTTGRCILRLIEPTAGEVWFEGRNVTALEPGRAACALPRHADHLPGPLRLAQSAHDGGRHHRRGADHPWARQVEAGVRGARRRAPGDGRAQGRPHAAAIPHEFSGGQRQRIGIARALAVEPKLIVCDEPVSALDVSIQAQVINLLEDLQEKFGLTYLFIAHDLSVVEHICDRVAVMYLGRIVEIASARAISTRRRGTPTPRPCCRPCRSPIRRPSASASCSRAKCRARCARRPAATSTRAARSASCRSAAKRCQRSWRSGQAIGRRATCVPRYRPAQRPAASRRRLSTEIPRPASPQPRSGAQSPPTATAIGRLSCTGIHARRHVDRRADDGEVEPRLAAHIAVEHVADMERDAIGDGWQLFGAALPVCLCQLLLRVLGRPQRRSACRRAIQLNSENSEYRVADEFENLAALPFDGASHGAEILVEHGDERVARKALGQRSEVTQVAEPDHCSDRLTHAAPDLTVEHAPA